MEEKRMSTVITSPPHGAAAPDGASAEWLRCPGERTALITCIVSNLVVVAAAIRQERGSERRHRRVRDADGAGGWFWDLVAAFRQKCPELTVRARMLYAAGFLDLARDEERRSARSSEGRR
jgi:hypothetical protein